MDMPPSRYKVIEKGRQLVVIDTARGETVTRSLPKPPPPAVRRALEAMQAQRGRADPPRRAPPPSSPRSEAQPIPGEAVLTTQSWFDDKAPRRLYVGDGRNKGFAGFIAAFFFVMVVAFAIFGWPAAVVIAFLLIQSRKAWRGWVTSMLDGFDEV